MNSAQRRKEFRKNLRDLVSGRFLNTSPPLQHFYQHLRELAPQLKLDIIAKLLRLGQDRGGQEMTGALGRLSLVELHALQCILKMLLSPPDIPHLANCTAGFLLSIPGYDHACRKAKS